MTLCAACASGKTFSPMDAAKKLAVLEGKPEAEWPSRLTLVRAAAVRLAQQNRLAVYRKGKPADPGAFKGVYRLGPCPASDE
jgi:hypothetical protein